MEDHSNNIQFHIEIEKKNNIYRYIYIAFFLCVFFRFFFSISSLGQIIRLTIIEDRVL